MFSGLYTFGVEIKGDVLQNLSTVTTWESYVLRAIFLLVMLTHTPFVFFIGKESVLCLAVLIYQRFQTKEDVEDPQPEFIETDNNMDKLLTSSRTKAKSLTNRSRRSVKVNDTLSVHSIDVTISMALPFSRKTIVVEQMDASTVGNHHNNENAAAHLLLPNSIYYPVTLILFFMVVGTACVINDVESVIKYIGSLGNSILNFLIPGICYFIIMRKYEKEKTASWKLWSALGLAIYGGSLALL